MKKLYGSIEAGGTKFVCAIGDESNKIIESAKFSTTNPKETIAKCGEFFRSYPVLAIGIGSFGPIDINKNSSTFGFITSTPKPGWANFDFLGELKKYVSVPVFWTTDVNSSAYGEINLGAAKGKNSVVYFTIGTGIGGSAIANGGFVGTFSHLEMGHAFVKKHHLDADFEGVCPYHKCCLEGLASGPSIKARTGAPGEDLPRDHKVFDIISYYAGQVAYNTFLNFSPECIIFGGSVLGADDMKKVRVYFEKFNAGYVSAPNLEELIQSPAIQNNGSATIGNFLLAKSLTEK
ncbi:MAG: ROK family protein [Bifidobacteriaceae bacterium]|jgi:fructokinase|nr:ROK family protein [Bifidobacteriaceae bacterium]